MSSLCSSSAEEILESAVKLQKLYSVDIEDTFPVECLHLKGYLETFPETDRKQYSSLSLLYKLLLSKKLQSTYPNVCIALKIFLTTPATNCTAERSFSALARVNDYRRSTQTQGRLNETAILYIENSMTVKLEFEDIIASFAQKRARRKAF